METFLVIAKTRYSQTKTNSGSNIAKNIMFDQTSSFFLIFEKILKDDPVVFDEESKSGLGFKISLANPAVNVSLLLYLPSCKHTGAEGKCYSAYLIILIYIDREIRNLREAMSVTY